MAIVDRLGVPLVQGPFRYNVRAAATGNVTLAGEQTIDGIACTRGQRVLCVGQTNGAENGLWIVSTGQWTRPNDWVTQSHALNAIITVEEGTGSKFYKCTTIAPIVIGTTVVAFSATSLEPGPQGPQGDKGDKGDKGDTGDPGPTGPAGPQADMPAATIKGRADGAGTGSPQDLTGEQVADILTPFLDLTEADMPEATIRGRAAEAGTGPSQELTGEQAAAIVAPFITPTISANSITPAKLALGAWTDVVSGAAVDLGAQASRNIVITGTTTINSFGSTATPDNVPFNVRFSGALTLTHGPNLICPGGVNLALLAGDVIEIAQESAGVWRVLSTNKIAVAAPAATGAPLPQAATGVGQWVRLNSTPSSGVSLPAGGTWAWFYTLPHPNPGAAGVSAGGTILIDAPYSGFYSGLGFAWRIA